MISSRGLTAAAALALTLLGCSPTRPEPSPPPTGGNPTTAPTRPAGGAFHPAPAADTTPAAAPDEQPPAAGIFGVPPASVTPAPTTTAAAAAARADPAAVARGYAAALYTVDWTRPLPGAQKLAATMPWATAAATAKLAHGQHYQPTPTDPRVAAAQVDTVERVVVEDADPVPDARAYLATIDVRTRSTQGVTTSQAFLLSTLVRQAGGWLVDDSQVVG